MAQMTGWGGGAGMKVRYITGRQSRRDGSDVKVTACPTGAKPCLCLPPAHYVSLEASPPC